MPTQTDIDIAGLPKIELHLHLEGALRLETVRELALRNRAEDPAGAFAPGGYQDLPGFVDASGRVLDACLRVPADYERIAYELCEDLARQNVRYAEVSVAWSRARRLGIPFAELIAALDSARQRAARSWPIRVGWIVGFSRERGAPHAVEAVRAVIAARAGGDGNGVVGIDLHGNEASVPAAEFAGVYALARVAGLGLRAHAGEGVGAQSVWEVLRRLAVTRIAHGVRAIEDPELLDYLRDHEVTLDVCPTSNVRLGVAPSLREHPLRRLYDHGLRVTISSDDPLFFATTVTRELELVHHEQGFTLDELKRVTLYAADAAFLPAGDRAALRAAIERDYPPPAVR